MMTAQKREDRTSIFVVSEIFFPEATSTGYYLTAIAERLALQFPVHVFCSAPAMGLVPAGTESYHGIQIVRFGRMNHPTTTIMRRALGAFGRMLKILFHLLRVLKAGNKVLTVTNPPFLPPMVAFVCFLKRGRLVLLVHDIYPDAAVVAGVIERNSTRVRAWRFLQSWVYRSADKIICLGRDAKRLIVLTEPRAERKVIVIPNWAETETVRVLDSGDSSFAIKYQLTQRFVVLYAGNLGRTHDPDLIVEAARQLEWRPEIVLLVAATGARFADFATTAERSARSNLLVVPLPRSRDQQSDTLAAGNVVLITFKAGMEGVSVPSRMYNAMAAGKPLIAVTEPESELALVIREEAIGWVVSPGDSEGLVRAILEAYANPTGLREMGGRARAAAVTKYSAESILALYHQLFTSLGHEQGPAC